MATEREIAVIALLEAVRRNRDLLEQSIPPERAGYFHYGMREIADAWDRYSAACQSEKFQTQVRS